MAVTSASDQIMVPFAGDGTGVEELTWGQRDIWRMMQASGTPRMVGGARPVAPGTTVEHLAHVLSFVVSRHQSLRTRIRVDPDGTPRQVLAAEGEVALEIVDAADTEDPAEVAQAVKARFSTEPFDMANQWPVRMAVVRHHGTPAHFVVMYPHIAIDGYGFDALVGDLAKLDRSSGEHLAPRSGVQPLDLARLQRAPAARRQSAAALRHWERLLDASPPRQFHGLRPQDPRCWEATYDSPAALLALAVLAARLRVHTGAILMAAYATALGRVTGIPTRLIRTQVSNRFRPGLALSVSTLVQPGLCLIDTGCTFPEAATRAWQSQLAAARHAYYDPSDLRTLLDAFPGRDPLSYFNDRRRRQPPPAPGQEPLPTGEEIVAALPRSTFTPGVRFDTPDTTTYLNVNRSETSLNYTLRVDTAALTPGDQVKILRSIEEILTSTATAEPPDAKPRRPAPHRPGGLRHGRDPEQLRSARYEAAAPWFRTDDRPCWEQH